MAVAAAADRPAIVFFSSAFFDEENETCIKLAPLLRSLPAEYTACVFVKVDAHENGETRDAFEVTTVPIIKVIVNKQVVETLTDSKEESTSI